LKEYSRCRGIKMTYSRKRNPIRDLPDDRTGRSQRRRSDFWACVAVDDDCTDDVEDCVGALEEEERFGVLLWVFQFGDEAEEGDVAG
jgi:hypothetical protein